MHQLEWGHPGLHVRRAGTDVVSRRVKLRPLPRAFHLLGRKDHIPLGQSALSLGWKPHSQADIMIPILWPEQPHFLPGGHSAKLPILQCFDATILQ